MSRKSSSVIALLLCSALAFTATGCGKKKSATTTSAAAATTTVAATTTTAATTATTTETTATTTETTSGATTNALSGLTSAENCAQLATLGAGLSQAFSGAAGGDLQKSAELLKEFADKTPSDIRADFQTLADAYKKIADALKGVDLSAGKTPSPEVLAKLTKLGTELNQTKLTQAEANISAWAQKNCGTTP